jgi:hypothetical protein
MSLVRLGCLFTCALAGVALAGCSKKVESPEVGLSRIQPNLVCNSQRLDPDATVTLTGSGFTPMPTNVLVGPSILVLPEVTLARSQDLRGSAAGGTPWVFHGEPGKELSSNLVWTSSTEMTIRISESSPAIDLGPGLYDVTVTNPDGEQTFTESRGLAVVPPPAISGVTPIPPALCTDQGARALEISGQNFLVVAGTKPTVTVVMGDARTDLGPEQLELSSCAAIPGTFAGGQVQLCDTIVATLGDGQLPPGAYSVVVTSPAPASCASVESHTFLIVPPPLVEEILPPSICLDQDDQTLTVTGGQFARVHVGNNAGSVPTVTLTSEDGTTMDYVPELSGCGVPDGIDAAFGVELCNTLEVSVPSRELEPGDYLLTVMNPDPIGCVSEDVISVRVNPPPRVDAIMPEIVCSGGSILQLTGSDFLPGATVELRCASTTVTAIAVDVTSSTAATAIFGPGITAGDVCDVVFRNPDGCEDRPVPHQTVTGTEGPILFNVDPHVAYSGIDTRVSLFVTTLDGSFVVTMWPDGDASDPVTLEAQLAPGKTTVIQAVIPEGTAPSPDGGPGYTLQVSDQSGCLASLPDAVRVTDTLVVQDGTVIPEFGYVGASTPITITLGSNPGASGTPRAFLNPVTGNDPAIQLLGLTVVDGTTLTAVVPAGTPVGHYDVVIVWPDGSVARLARAYESEAEPPPVIDEVVPQSIVNAAGQSIEIRGTGFSDSIVTLTCRSPAGATTTLNATAPAESCTAGRCTQTATVNASSLADGSVCVVRVWNDQGEGSYFDYSAIGVTGPSLNLQDPAAGPPLGTGRRALIASAVQATSASRFVYAIGGDDGAVANAFSSIEIAPVDIFGTMRPFFDSATSLTLPRAFAAVATVGRYIYALGGNDGAGALASAERALVLSPEETPVLHNVDLCLSSGSTGCFGVAGLGGGLDAGVYSYRVAAIIDDADPVNLGGETLASDPMILRLRDRVTVRIGWDAPVDSEGVELSGITGYRIYRTPADGSPGSDEVLLAEVEAATLSFIDDGGGALGTRAPLPLGSTSAWQVMPDMGTARMAAGGFAIADPEDGDLSDGQTWYVYATLGRNANGALGTYEFLPITALANGRQMVAAGWTAGAETATARSEHGVYVVDERVSSAVSGGQVFVYLAAGRGGAGNVGTAEVAELGAGGQLGSFGAVSSMSPQRSGFGHFTAGSGSITKLFVFGGMQANPTSNALAASLSATLPGISNWNNEGLSMQSARYLMGTAVQSAFAFFIGGASNGTGTNALTSSETVVW